MPLVPFVAFGLLVELLEELSFEPFGCVPDAPPFIDPPVFAGVPLSWPFGGAVTVPFVVVPLFIEFPLCWAHVPPPMSAGRTRFGGATFCAA